MTEHMRAQPMFRAHFDEEILRAIADGPRGAAWLIEIAERLERVPPHAQHPVRARQAATMRQWAASICADAVPPPVLRRGRIVHRDPT